MHQGVVDLVPAALQHSIGFVRSGSAPPVANSGRDKPPAADRRPQSMLYCTTRLSGPSASCPSASSASSSARRPKECGTSNTLAHLHLSYGMTLARSHRMRRMFPGAISNRRRCKFLMAFFVRRLRPIMWRGETLGLQVESERLIERMRAADRGPPSRRRPCRRHCWPFPMSAFDPVHRRWHRLGVPTSRNSRTHQREARSSNPVPANRRGFLAGRNPRNSGRLVRHIGVCEPNSTVLPRSAPEIARESLPAKFRFPDLHARRRRRRSRHGRDPRHPRRRSPDQTRENGRNWVRRPRHASPTDRNCEGFSRPGNRVGLIEPEVPLAVLPTAQSETPVPPKSATVILAQETGARSPCAAPDAEPLQRPASIRSPPLVANAESPQPPEVVGAHRILGTLLR